MEQVERHLEKAEKLLNNNKIEAAINEYKAALELKPDDVQLLSSLADLLARAKRTEELQQYAGILFDKYAQKKDATRAVNVFQRALSGSPQPGPRYFQFARLLERLGKADEAVQAYQQACEKFVKEKKNQEAVDCLSRMAGLKQDDAKIQIQLGEQANKMGQAELAAQAFQRAGQLLVLEDLPQALKLLQRAYDLNPGERTAAMAFSKALVAGGDCKQAVELLLPLYADSTTDPAVLQTLAEALLGENRLVEAEEVLEAYSQIQPDGYEKLFELVDVYCKADQHEKGIGVLKRVQDRLRAARREKEFMERLEKLFSNHQGVMPLAEFVAGVFNEANDESRYAQVLGSIFNAHLAGGDGLKATEILERLIDIDPYDYENQKRLEQLKGKIDDARYAAVAKRITGGSALTVEDTAVKRGVDALEEEVSGSSDPKDAVLEDLMVQVEIFLQYSLKAKAIEKLQELYQEFPGEEARNTQLYDLYEQAQYFPPGFAKGGPAAPPAHGAPAAPAASSTETVSDLAKISEITHVLFRQGSPKEILQAAVMELGKYMKISRCLGTLGRPGKLPSVAVEFCSPGVPQFPRAGLARLLAMLAKSKMDPDSGVALDSQLTPGIAQVGVQSVLCMPLIEKEKQVAVGLLVLCQVDSARQWKPNEVYLLKAVADQVETTISHTQMRSLMKTMTIADDGSGMLRRSSYLDTLVTETRRNKMQGTPLVVVLLELDKGNQLMSQLGESNMEKFMREAGTIILSQTRQNDLGFWYTATALALMLNDTTVKKCQPMVEKLRKVLNEMELPGLKSPVCFSAAISEAAIRPDYDELDIVTDVVNRADLSLEQARKKGNTLKVW